MTQPMTRADLQAVSDRYLDAFKRRDPIAIAAFHTPEGIVESPMFATLRGRKAIEDAQRAFFASFPDAATSLEATVVDPPHVAMFLTMNATHVNEFFGLPGNRPAHRVPAVAAVADGRRSHRARDADLRLHWFAGAGGRAEG